ncbi:MAG: ABC transporter ATP-binding protein [Marinilabiliaceae bacterium]|nr:ABC transporter ATP-binding protein [Marinilabiliaceae bacterium]
MLEIINISKDYGGFALQEINLSVKKGEYFVLLGRSGAGKSQLLENIAGLRRADSGTLILDSVDISHEKIQSRPVGLVYQDFALFPHLSVYDNIAYPLRMVKEKKEEIAVKVKRIAEETNIAHLLDRKPEDLSGGEKQRVAVSRTLVRSPKIILLDEPMASIDTPLRDDLRRLLRKINRQGMTILHVTHDYREAIRLADRIGVIHNGRIIQQGTPDEVFDKPVNRFVARFAGIQNFFRVNIREENGFFVGEGRRGLAFKLPGKDYPEDGIVMLRSDDIILQREKPGCSYNCFEGSVTEINRAENGFELFVDARETFYVTLAIKNYRQMQPVEGEKIYLSFDSEAIRVM